MSTCARGGSLAFTPAFLFWANPQKDSHPGSGGRAQRRINARRKLETGAVVGVLDMVLASSLSERHPKQSLSSSISGPPVTKTDVLLASARPTQKSGCQQTSWMGLISPWSRFWTRLDPAKPSTHVPEGAPAEAEANRWPLWPATACPGPRGGQHGSSRPATGMLPLDRNPSRLG